MPAVAPTPIYHAAPPEVHSTLLNTGATAAGVTAAGTSWTQLAAQYTAGIAELEAILAQVQATYQGPSAEKFVAAHQPLLAEHRGHAHAQHAAERQRHEGAQPQRHAPVNAGRQAMVRQAIAPPA